MAESTGLTASDVALMTRDNDNFFGEGLWGVILLLIVAGVIGGNGFFGYGNGAVAAGLTRAEMDSEFVQRDIFNVNTNVLENKYASALGMADISKEVLENRYNAQLCCCNTQKEVLNNRYENALATAGLEKDILLGNCDIKSAIDADGEKTRALLIAQNEARLLEKINDLKAQVNNQEQSQYILSTIGRWHAYPSCSNGCGCGYSLT